MRNIDIEFLMQSLDVLHMLLNEIEDTANDMIDSTGNDIDLYGYANDIRGLAYTSKEIISDIVKLLNSNNHIDMNKVVELLNELNETALTMIYIVDKMHQHMEKNNVRNNDVEIDLWNIRKRIEKIWETSRKIIDVLWCKSNG